MKLPRFVKYWIPAIAWMALIFIGSTDILSAEHTSRFLVPILRWLDPQISWATLNAIQTIIRKLGHVTEYAILAVLMWRALRGGTVWKSKTSILFAIAWIACAVFAASDEFHQSFVPSRTASFHDVMIDLCGALIGLSICIALATRKVVKERRA
ncbi:MAG TPA: VanZ family protein [Chthoniobacterales bacterium]|jgi:VanZ family protein|nr:VanZ family protein [Chthoniobacterales bacterium]